ARREECADVDDGSPHDSMLESITQPPTIAKPNVQRVLVAKGGAAVAIEVDRQIISGTRKDFGRRRGRFGAEPQRKNQQDAPADDAEARKSERAKERKSERAARMGFPPFHAPVPGSKLRLLRGRPSGNAPDGTRAMSESQP